MLLEGSCHCGVIRFRVRSVHPYPFNLCGYPEESLAEWHERLGLTTPD